MRELSKEEIESWRSLSKSERDEALTMLSEEQRAQLLKALKEPVTKTRRDAAREYEERRRLVERDIRFPDIEDIERRTSLEQDDPAWLKHYFPKVFNLPFTKDQMQSVEEVGHCLRYGNKECIAGPRFDGKTSITRYLLLKYMLTKESPFGLYVASSDGKAEQSEKAIKQHLRISCRQFQQDFIAVTPLAADYPFECAVSSYVARAPSRANNVTTAGGAKIHVQWAGDEWILPSLEAGAMDDEEAWERWRIKPGELGSILIATGIMGSVLQGANVLDMRPSFVVLDDLDSRDSLTVEDGKMAPKIEQIIEKTISGMQGPGLKMGQIMLCTVTARRSIAFWYSDPETKPAWGGRRVKRLKSYPDRLDLWDQYMTLRKKGQKEKKDGRTIDPDGRTAHQFYLDNFDAMNAGADVGNPYVHDETIQKDGSKRQVSSLQWCYDFMADGDADPEKGEEAFNTEYQQEPPEGDEVNKILLSAYHVQHNARSGCDKNIVPPETKGIACGLDIKKIGFHYVVWAFTDSPTRAACIDYNFHETKFAGDYLRVEDAERAILKGLHEWRDARDDEPYCDMDGTEFRINLALIDQGWKHETWATQPADQFCAEAGLARFLPCKGWGDGQYRRPQRNRRLIIGDNCHVSFSSAVPHVNWNTDHYKMRVHEGFLTAPGEAGSLSLFEPSAAKTGRRIQPHFSFAKHIVSEVFEERFIPGYRGMVSKWWKDGSQNHYLDASAQGLVAISILGGTTLASTPAPAPVSSYGPPQDVMADDFGGSRSW